MDSLTILFFSENISYHVLKFDSKFMRLINKISLICSISIALLLTNLEKHANIPKF